MTRSRQARHLADALDTTVEVAERQADEFDARAERLEKRTTSYADEHVQSVDDSRSTGVCVRVWLDGASGFASSHALTDEAIEEMVETASRIARSNARRDNHGFPFVAQGGGQFEHASEITQDPFEAGIPRIVELLERCYEAAQEREPDARTSASLASMKRDVLYRDSAGRRGESTLVLSTLASMTVCQGTDRTGSGVAAIGGERGLSELADEATPERIGRDAALDAREAVHAQPVPAGRQRVLCDNHLSGVLAHESFGHLIEADVVEMGWSLLSGRVGESFADEGVNVVDTPTPPEGVEGGVPLPYDQEGVAGRPVRILDDGVLENLLHVRGSAVEQGVEPTGNGRSLNARYPPIVRMRNTFFEPGDMTREEALEELGDGVYLVGNRGGAPASDGTFMFTSKKGYLVEDGEIREPVRSTSISGHILDFLENVEGLTQDFDMKTTNFGGCGKWGQSLIPVGIGGPHILADDVLIGGEDS